jgi:hypothetical protein
MDVLTPSQTLYLQDLSGSYDVTSAITRGSARPLCCSPISHLNTFTVRVFVPLRSDYFFVINDLSQVL